MCWPDCTGVQILLWKQTSCFLEWKGKLFIHLITLTTIIDGYQIKRRGSGFVDTQADLHLYYFISCILEALFDVLLPFSLGWITFLNTIDNCTRLAWNNCARDMFAQKGFKYIKTGRRAALTTFFTRSVQIRRLSWAGSTRIWNIWSYTSGTCVICSCGSFKTFL